MFERIFYCRVALAASILLASFRSVRADEPWPTTIEPDAKLVEVYSDDLFFEGPFWEPREGKLYFTAFGKDNSQILRLDAPGKATVWADKTGGINGTFISHNGRLLGAQGERRRIIDWAFGSDGPAEEKVLADSDELVKPNDLCQTACGDVYFTDPDFAKPGPEGRSAVYRVSPSGELTKVIDNMALPNGIIASLDGRTIYVADSHEKRWRAYNLQRDGSLDEGRVFFQPDVEDQSSPDGMTIDEQGNLYFTGCGGLWVVSPQGKSLGFVPAPVFVSNVTFGGEEGKAIYLTGSKKVFSLEGKIRGGGLVKSER